VTARITILDSLGFPVGTNGKNGGPHPISNQSVSGVDRNER
jgi:hypothetical protein